MSCRIVLNANLETIFLLKDLSKDPENPILSPTNLCNSTNLLSKIPKMFLEQIFSSEFQTRHQSKCKTIIGQHSTILQRTTAIKDHYSLPVAPRYLPHGDIWTESSESILNVMLCEAYNLLSNNCRLQILRVQAHWLTSYVTLHWISYSAEYYTHSAKHSVMHYFLPSFQGWAFQLAWFLGWPTNDIGPSESMATSLSSHTSWISHIQGIHQKEEFLNNYNWLSRDIQERYLIPRGYIVRWSGWPLVVIEKTEDLCWKQRDKNSNGRKRTWETLGRTIQQGLN